MLATAGLQTSQPVPVPKLVTSSANVRIPVPATIWKSSARLCAKCSQSALDTSTPSLTSSVLSMGTHEPQLVPARVHALRAGTSWAPPAIAAHRAPLVTALHEHTWAESGSESAPISTPPGLIIATGSAGSGEPTSGRNVAYREASPTSTPPSRVFGSALSEPETTSFWYVPAMASLITTSS